MASPRPAHLLPAWRVRKKRSDSHDGTENPVERKRVRNRVAQKSYREKQQAYLQHLEAIVETVKSGYEPQDGSDRYDRLLRDHLDLLEQNRLLQDTVLQLRQKLSSIGDSATAAANDSLLSSVLNSARRETGPEPEQKHPAPSVDIESEPASQGIVDSDSWECSDEPDPHPPSMTQWTFPEPSVAGSLSMALPVSPRKEFKSLQQGSNMNPIAYSRSIGGVVPFSPISLDSYCFRPYRPVLLKSKWLLLEKVEVACRQYISQYPAQPISSEMIAGRDCTNPQRREIAQQISSAASQFVGRVTGIFTYIYGSNFHKYMDLIWQWRLSRAIEDYIAIPEPFRPTQLQLSSFNYPVIIDTITWPTIRDQLILHRHTLDDEALDSLCCDLTLHTVIEFPDMCISIGVFDYFQTFISSSSWKTTSTSGKSCLEDPNWTFIHVSSDSPFLSSADPVQELITHEVMTCVQKGDRSPSRITLESSDLGSTWYGGMEKHVSNLRSLQGLVGQRSKWKLGKEFSQKWPIIDCSEVISPYDVTPLTMLSTLLC